MIKKIGSIILVVIWMSLIFFFSNSNGSTSKSTTDEIIKNTVVVIKKIEKDSKEMDSIIDKYSFIVRKSAHFIEYFILALLVFNALYVNNINKNIIIWVIIICFIYSISDEVHQLFIDGRSAQLRDVLIDTIASIIGSFITNLFYKRKKV